MARGALESGLRETLRPFAGKKLVVAVSGGLDSVALLDLLLGLREELGLKLVVAHADHGLRTGSREDARFVERLATGHGLPFTATALALRSGPNEEARAREARYRWFEGVRKRRRADFVVTAHQADDQVETLFLHLARGTGLTGLTGMQVLSGRILRPLLHVPRKDLARYVRRRKLEYRRDPSNRNVRYARNRIRHQVVRSLRKINPQLVETVSQSMRVFSNEYEVVRLLAARELAQVTTSVSGTERGLSRRKLLKLDRAVRHLVWREAIRILAGDLRGFALRHFEQLDDLLGQQTGSRVHLPRGVAAGRQYDEIILRKGAPLAPPKQAALRVPGDVRFGDQVVSAKTVTRARPEHTNRTAIVSAAATGPRLVVRPLQAGDRFKPVGMRGSKLVSDLLTDAKVARDERPWVPIVVKSGARGRRGEIVWVAGYRADRRFVPKHGDKRIVLRLA